MKTTTGLLLLLLALAAGNSLGQGSLVYDQESSTDETYVGGGVGIQSYGTVGQSFTPSLTTVGFFRVRIWDIAPGNATGATLIGTLRASAINGPVLGTSASLTLGDSFSGATNFVFATPVAVTPGVTYFFQVAAQSGDNWGITLRSDSLGDVNYPGGTFYGGPTSFPGNDLWFREGIVVPEPSVCTLWGCSLGLWFWLRRRVPGST